MNGPAGEDTKSFYEFTINGTADSVLYTNQSTIRDILYKKDYPVRREAISYLGANWMPIVIKNISDTGYISLKITIVNANRTDSSTTYDRLLPQEE